MIRQASDLTAEMERQRQILLREMPERLALTALAFALATVFADPEIVLVLWAVNLLTELAANAALARAGRSRRFYVLALALTVVIETAYVLAAGLAWYDPDSHAKAFAVGMAVVTLMHLATVRSIHLPIGLAGLAGAGGTILATTAHYWLARDDIAGFAISTAAAFGGLAYTVTAMLSNHRLHRMAAQSEAAARAADEAKTLFLAQMSHELRTPLNAIIGMGQAELAAAIARDPLAPSCDRLDLLVGSARNLATILDDVTDMNAISQGRMPMRPRTVQLRDEISGFVRRLGEQADRSGRSLEFRTMDPCPGPVRIDAVRLQQCLSNLVSNAHRHAPDGKVSAECRVEPFDDGSGGILRVDVVDDGPGVAPADREAIFEPFRKGRKGAPGSGLGLAIVRNLARRMGGDLVLLASDKGAHFRLTLAYETAAASDPAADSPPDLTGCSILVVDDIASNRLVAATYLRGMGARVIEAASGAGALAMLPSEDVDLVLLDVNMPGLDGFQTAAQTRRLGGRLRTLPIVAMTADVLVDQVEALHRAGFDGHVAKPILPEVLAAELARLL